MDRRLGTLRRATLGALIGGAGAMALALWLIVVPALGAYDGSIHLPWWALAAGFALTDAHLVQFFSGQAIENVPDINGQLRLVAERVMPAF